MNQTNDEKGKIKRPWYKRWWATMLFVLIGLGVIGSFMDSSEQPQKAASATQSNNEQNQKANIVTQSVTHELLQQCIVKCVGNDTGIPCIIDFCESSCDDIYYYGGNAGLKGYLNNETKIFMPSGTC